MAVKTKAAQNRSILTDGRGIDAPQQVTIERPNLRVALFRVCGTTPFVQNKFAEKAKQEMMLKQMAGEQAKKGKKRTAKDFDECFRNSMYETVEGWRGIPAPAFRSAMISACRICGFQMTRAKLSVFVLADGCDRFDGTPLVRILKGEPEKHIGAVRNESGVADIRARAMWREWEADLRVRFDADQFTVVDVANLLLRAGQQVGIGEGRHDSRNCSGLGWGEFRVSGEPTEDVAS